MRVVTTDNSRLLGFVQFRVGERAFAVPVQAMKLARDGGAAPGGFFDEDGELGIVVDANRSDVEVQAQIAKASEDAFRYFARKFLS